MESALRIGNMAKAYQDEANKFSHIKILYSLSLVTGFNFHINF